VCSEAVTEHTNALCGHNVEFLNVKSRRISYIVTTWLLKDYDAPKSHKASRTHALQNVQFKSDYVSQNCY
jgi:hypothetical protein